MVAYDSAIIQQSADRLYRRARTVVITSTILGILIGGALGLLVGMAIAVPISEWQGGVDLAAVSSVFIGGGAGAVLFGLLFFAAGRQSAFLLKLRAQTALCQMRIEENTRR